MKLFGWKSAGRGMLRPARTHVALTRPFGARAFAGGVIGEWPRSYEAQLREGYMSNVIAQRAVRLVAEGVASAPLSASDDAALALVRATSGGQSLLETLSAQARALLRRKWRNRPAIARLGGLSPWALDRSWPCCRICRSRMSPRSTRCSARR